MDDAQRAVVDAARDEAAHGHWNEAFDLLSRADADGQLGAEDLPALGDIAYRAGHLDVTIEAWERAHVAGLAAGDAAAAAVAAVRVALHLLFDTAMMAPVRGWSTRAERLLAGQDESAASAWLAVVRTYERFLSGDAHNARHWARRAVEVGSRQDTAAAAVGLVAEARLLILDGEVVQGLALLDEAGAAALSGELDPLSTGIVFCELVCALQGLAQYDLAEEWTEAFERWSRTSAIGSLRGRCRVHRAEILTLRGSLDEAEQEVLAASEELRPYLRRELGWPLNVLGRIRLGKGDIDGAERSFLEAHRLGWDAATRAVAGSAGAGRRCRGVHLDPRGTRASGAGALQGSSAEHRTATGPHARGSCADRAGRRQRRPSSRRGRRAPGGGHPVPQQGLGCRRGAGPGTATAHGR